MVLIDLDTVPGQVAFGQMFHHRPKDADYKSNPLVHLEPKAKNKIKNKGKFRTFLANNEVRLLWTSVILLLLLVLGLLYKTTIVPSIAHAPDASSTCAFPSGSATGSVSVYPSVSASVVPSVSTSVSSSATTSASASVSAFPTSTAEVVSPMLLVGNITEKHIGHSHGGHDHDHDHEEHEEDDHASYNLPLHVGAIFMLLIVSLLACALPLLARGLLQCRTIRCIFFMTRHLGSGVVLATAFVHLYPTAFSALTHPSLPAFFTETYPSLPGAVSMAAILVVIAVEMTLSPGRVLGAEFVADCMHAPVFNQADSAAAHGHNAQVMTEATHTMYHGNKVDVEAQAAKSAKTQQILQCRLLESGIVFHSLFIGMTLSVAYGPGFLAFVVAIMFHQAFEGMALGARIADINWACGSIQPWIMVAFYTLTTPVGQAIGIAVRSLYDPESPTGLLVVGFANAVSGGLLTFAALAEIIPQDFLSIESWKYLQGWRRVGAYGLVVLGALLMSLVAYWA